jgi:hypothetical protein
LTWIRIVAATIKVFCLPWNTFPVRMTIYISQILRIYLAVLNYLLARWRLGIFLVLLGLNLVPSENGMFRITFTLTYLSTVERVSRKWPAPSGNQTWVAQFKVQHFTYWANRTARQLHPLIEKYIFHVTTLSPLFTQHLSSFKWNSVSANDVQAPSLDQFS